MLESNVDNLASNTSIFVLAIGILVLIFILFFYLRSRSSNIKFIPINTDLHLPRDESRLRKEYETYIKSNEWEKLKNVALERANNKCEICGAPSQAVHHKSYPTDFKNDNLDNLQVLCHGCHYEIHRKQIEANKRETIYSDSVLSGKQHFSVEVKTAVNETKYVIINELRADVTGRFNDRKILIFEENLDYFKTSLDKAIDFVKHSKKS